MSAAARRNRPSPHFPFIALADIAWQIIIFFLVAATFAKNTSMKVELPSSSKSANANDQKQITVSAGESVLLVNDKPVAMESLVSNLKSQIAGKKNEPVIFMGREDLSFQRNCDIMYAIQQAGGVLVLAEEQ